MKSGGLTRFSTFMSGVILLFLIVVLGPVVAVIPMAGLVAVMIMVAIGTFSWKSIKDIRFNPWQSSVVMLATVIITVWTHDLAQGVGAGVILSGLFFASKVKRLFTVETELSADNTTRTYRIGGQVFFASSDSFVEAFDFKEVLDRVVIDVSNAQFWDISAVGTLDKAILKFRREGTAVEIVGLNETSAALIERYATHDKPGAEASLGAH